MAQSNLDIGKIEEAAITRGLFALITTTFTSMTVIVSATSPTLQLFRVSVFQKQIVYLDQ